jgi:hypothetical protein
MIIAATVTLSLSLFAAAPPSAANALSSLETARANVAKAVKAIEKDPPNTADLEAARSAVTALKEAIDAGAEQEAGDLDYAKAALAARKELRTQREYVDKRYANIHIHEQRRKIDAALEAMNSATSRTEGKGAGAKDFEDARAAVNALKGLVDKSRSFVSADPAFGTYLTELQGKVSKKEKELDERWTQQMADKHNALVAQDRLAFTEAMAKLNKEASDAEFDAAQRAATALEKRLEEGRPLEAKDKGYRADAEKTRTDLAQARKKMDGLWSETGLARLKAEIEPAHKDLIAATKTLRARKPSADQLAEAKTAAIVVRKLVEKFQPQVERSREFRQYVNTEVKATLAEAEVELERRTLESARAELTQAMRAVERRDPTDEQFQEATTATTVLEKTLETVHTKNPGIGPHVSDARAAINGAKQTLALRRVQVDIQRQKVKVDAARRKASDLVRQAQQGDAEQVQEAEAGVEQLRKSLEEGAPLVKKDSDYRAFDKDVKERITELKERLAQRKIALAATEGRGQLTDRITSAKSALEVAKKPESTDADVKAASQAVEAVQESLEARAALEKQDKGYAAQAERGRGELGKLMEGLELAKAVLALRKETVDALLAGAAASADAEAAPSLRHQKDQLTKALGHYKSCANDGDSTLKANPALAKAAVVAEGQPSTARDVVTLCGQRAQATAEKLKQVVPLLQFEEGPRRSFETAKGLLAKNKKSEALAQFDECVATGMILQTKNPELKEQKFEVGGSTTTLVELTRQCIAQQKALKAK